MRTLALATVVSVLLYAAHAQEPAIRDPGRRMSFHNRLLLNRAALAGLDSIQVLMLASGPPFRTREVSDAVARAGGHVQRIEESIGYLRVDVPIGRLLEIAASGAIAAYQISSFSRASWYRDGPPLLNAEMFRGFEVTPIAADEPKESYAHLPLLTPEESRKPGYTAARDVGLDEWFARHPTFDGRGVTIGLVETAIPAFDEPALRMAKTLDGRDVPKIAGILNAMGADDPDDTRVRLDRELHARTSWARVDGRTYILPSPGTFRFGVFTFPGGANLLHHFGVIERVSSGEVWIDTNGDGSFQDETPLADVNERFEPQSLKLMQPSRVDVSFVMGRGRTPDTVHIYLGRGGHQAMTLSVVAGGHTEKRLAFGVAPNARVLLVRNHGPGYALTALLEGFIEAAAHPEVDLVTASAGITIVPDTAASFTGLLFSRLTVVHGKPIVNAAGNTKQQLGTVMAHGGSLSAGGSLGPETYAALHGGRTLDGLIVHLFSAAGPSLDGAIKPDFVAPEERLAAGLPWRAEIEAVPRNAPVARMPPGYGISCCTSASGPYSAGIAALVLSAARQSGVSYSVESLARAMTLTARFLPGFQSHQQGHGLLDVEAAWQELAAPRSAPRIVATADIVHPLAQYAERGPRGSGILEFEGWDAGMKAERTIGLRRESGPERPVTYGVSWTGNNGTFRAPSSVTLPKNETVALPVTIHPRTPGAHSALLNLHDPSSQAIVFRTQATIVAPERLDPSSKSLRLTGTAGLMRANSHYIHIPPGLDAISFDLEVIQGVVSASILRAHGFFPSYYLHVHPTPVGFQGKGRYRVVLPNPEPGTWTFHVITGFTWMPRLPDEDVQGDDQDAYYTLEVGALDAAVDVSLHADGEAVVELRNTGGAVREPVVHIMPARLRSHRAAFPRNGLANVFDIDVPEGASTLSLRVRADRPEDSDLELYLYDCTSGECFSYDIGFPAGREQALLVRNPKPGRWVAAVNAAPFPAPGGGFVLDEIVAAGDPRAFPSPGALAPGALRSVRVEPGSAPAALPGWTSVHLVELIDAAAEREQTETYPWVRRPSAVKMRDRPVAVGSAVLRMGSGLESRK